MIPERPEPPDTRLPPPEAPAPVSPASAAAPSATDIVLRWVKEAVTASIGITLVVCLVTMLWKAFGFLGREQSDPSFQRVKDLLLFINPLVGVVIGYYFNRVSTEARAENAERTAQGATMSALHSEAARGEAQSRAQLSKVEAEEAKSALEEIIPAAQTVLSQMPPLPLLQPPSALAGVASTSGAASDAPLTEARVNLQMALERARAVARRGGRRE